MESRAKFAVKVVEKRMLKSDKTLIFSLELEVKIHTSIKSMFVPQLEQTFEDKNHHFLFMQLCQYSDLQQMLNTRVTFHEVET